MKYVIKITLSNGDTFYITESNVSSAPSYAKKFDRFSAAVGWFLSPVSNYGQRSWFQLITESTIMAIDENNEEHAHFFKERTT